MADEPRPINIEPVGDVGGGAPSGVDPGARAGTPIGEGPIFELAADPCPRCGAAMGAHDIVCVRCGYDQRGNTVRTPVTGVEIMAEAPERPTFVTPGRGSARAVALVGLAMTVGAAIAAGVNTPPGASAVLVLGTIALVVYEVAVHTGTGLVAVGVSARIAEERYGSPELAAARVLAAFAAFELVTRLNIPEPYVGTVLKWLLAGGVYWGAVLLLFRKTPAVALMIVASHAVLWVLVRLGMDLAGWVHVGTATAADAAARHAAAGG